MTAVDITVTGTSTDIIPPVIDSDSLQVTLPEGKDFVVSGETSKVGIAVSDEGLGVSRVNAVYIKPVSGEELNLQLVYNSETDQWEKEISLDGTTEYGTWKIYQIEAFDKAGNKTSITNSELDPESADDLSKGDFTVYCTVTFDTRGGSEIATQYVVPGKKATKPDDPTKGGGSWQGGGDFSGWYADDALTQEFNFNNPITEDTTVYAKWAYAFSVCSYDKTNSADYDGGKYMVLQHGATEDDLCYGGCNYTLYDGDSITLKAYPDKGYIFAGWFKGEYIGMVDNAHTQVSRPLDMSEPANLLSTEPQYSFVIDKYTVICPVFEVCTNHYWQEKVQKATPDTDGRIYKICSICGAEETVAPLLKVSNITLEGTSFTYNGEAIEPKVTVANDSEELSADCYDVEYSNNTNPGKATVKVTLKGDYYEGTKELTFTITKPVDEGGNGGNGDSGNTPGGSGTTPGGSGTVPSGSGVAPGGTDTQVTKSVNPMKAKAKTVKIKYSKIKNKKQTIKAKKAFKITGAKGKVTFKVAKYDKKAKKKIKVSKTGKITVKKGLKKGTYRLKVAVTAAGNSNYMPATRIVTLKVRVR